MTTEVTVSITANVSAVKKAAIVTLKEGGFLSLNTWDKGVSDAGNVILTVKLGKWSQTGNDVILNDGDKLEVCRIQALVWKNAKIDDSGWAVCGPTKLDPENNDCKWKVIAVA